MVSISNLRSKLFALFWIMVVVCNSGYLLQVSGDKISGFIQNITMIIGIAAFLNKMLKYKFEVLIKTTAQKVVFIFFVLSLLSMVVNFEISLLYVNLLATVFVAYYLVNKYTTIQVTSLFVNVMLTIAIISLIFTVWINIFGAPAPISTVSTLASSIQCNNYIVFFYPNIWQGMLIRNRGIFWEPGLFASYLILASVFEIEFSQKHSRWKLIIFVVTVLTTYSTAGIILLCLVGILLVDKEIENNNIRMIWFFVLILLGLTIFIFQNRILESLIHINPEVFSKLLGEDTSKTTRLGGPLLNLSIFYSHPIFGAGFSGATELFQNMKILFKADSQTSTSLYMMAALGIGGICYTIWWIKGIMTNKNFSFLSKIVIVIIVISILNKEPHNALMATWLILFVFLKNKKTSTIKTTDVNNDFNRRIGK